MVTKTNIVLTLFLFGTLLLHACKKKPVIDKPNTPKDYSHFEGTFYVKKINGYGYTSSMFSVSDKDTSDLSIQLRVENDSIKVFDYAFAIESIHQSSFSESRPDMAGGIDELRLDYYNNYDSVCITYNKTDHYSTVITKACRGIRSTSMPSSLNDGWYAFAIQHKKLTVGVDTQYTANVWVAVNEKYAPLNSGKTQLIIENDTFDFQNFWSYSNEYKIETTWMASSSLRVVNKKLIYWKNDSLCIDYLIAKEGTGFPPIKDTIHHSYRGRKQ